MALRTALGWSAVQTVVRIGLGFFSAKISAVYLGPPGVALIGQLTSFLQLTQASIGNTTGTAVVIMTADRRSTPERLNELWSTAMRMVWLMAAACFVAILVGTDAIASWLLGDAKYWWAVVLCGLAVVLAVTESIISSALNGLKQVGILAKASITSSVIEVAIFASLVYSFGLWGGLIGASAMYAGRLVITSTMAFRSGLISPRHLIANIDMTTARQIAGFYPMLIAHSIALPLAQILVRNSVIDETGLSGAGYLQAVWRLSDMYVGVMTTALGLYFISHYSGLTTDGERSRLLCRTVLKLSGITAIAAVLVYLARNLIVEIVLTKEFLPMGDLLPFHLMGDVFKMAGYPLAMALTAQQRRSWFIAQATVGPVVFAFLTSVLLPHLGNQAAPVAYASSYAITLTLMVYSFRDLFWHRDSVRSREDQPE